MRLEHCISMRFCSHDHYKGSCVLLEAIMCCSHLNRRKCFACVSEWKVNGFFWDCEWTELGRIIFVGSELNQCSWGVKFILSPQCAVLGLHVIIMWSLICKWKHNLQRLPLNFPLCFLPSRLPYMIYTWALTVFRWDGAF